MAAPRCGSCRLFAPRRRRAARASPFQPFDVALSSQACAAKRWSDQGRGHCCGPPVCVRARGRAQVDGRSMGDGRQMGDVTPRRRRERRLGRAVAYWQDGANCGARRVRRRVCEYAHRSDVCVCDGVLEDSARKSRGVGGSDKTAFEVLIWVACMRAMRGLPCALLPKQPPLVEAQKLPCESIPGPLP